MLSLLPLLLPHALLIHLTSAGIIETRMTGLRNAEHPVLVGKLASQQEDAFTLPVGSTGSSLVYLQDELSS